MIPKPGGRRAAAPATAAGQAMTLDASAVLSDVEDADMAQTITQYTTQQAAYSAALKAGANIVQMSLLDFLT